MQDARDGDTHVFHTTLDDTFQGRPKGVYRFAFYRRARLAILG